MISSLITQKVLEGKVYYYSVLESPRAKPPEYAQAYEASHLKSGR